MSDMKLKSQISSFYQRHVDFDAFAPLEVRKFNSKIFEVRKRDDGLRLPITCLSSLESIWGQLLSLWLPQMYGKIWLSWKDVC